MNSNYKDLLPQKDRETICFSVNCLSKMKQAEKSSKSEFPICRAPKFGQKVQDVSQLSVEISFALIYRKFFLKIPYGISGIEYFFYIKSGHHGFCDNIFASQYRKIL